MAISTGVRTRRSNSRNDWDYLYTTVSLGRNVMSVAYSLELKVLELPPADVCIIRQP